MPSCVDKCLTQINVTTVFFRTKWDVLEEITFVSHKLFLIKADMFGANSRKINSLLVWDRKSLQLKRVLESVIFLCSCEDHLVFWAKDQRSEEPKWVIGMFKSDTYLFIFSDLRRYRSSEKHYRHPLPKVCLQHFLYENDTQLYSYLVCRFVFG